MWLILCTSPSACAHNSYCFCATRLQGRHTTHRYTERCCLVRTSFTRRATHGLRFFYFIFLFVNFARHDRSVDSFGSSCSSADFGLLRTDRPLLGPSSRQRKDTRSIQRRADGWCDQPANTQMELYSLVRTFFVVLILLTPHFRKMCCHVEQYMCHVSRLQSSKYWR